MYVPMGLPVVFKQGSGRVSLPHGQTSVATREQVREWKQLSRDSVLDVSQPAVTSQLSSNYYNAKWKSENISNF